MKKLLLILAFVFLAATIANAEVENYYVSGSSVSFNTTVTVVTFNTVINSLYVRNESTTDSLFVFYKNEDIGWNSDKTQYVIPELNYTSTGVAVPSGSAVRLIPTTTTRWSDITLKEKTDIFAFVWQRSAKDARGVTYIAEDDARRP